ncbi:uncharacterized protein Z520_02872 [Fonsecaea multimorphosa CBS 102226]|uniref:Uncharacterized protein n=1 Tax=Fonsecaea multimorphosa CBS 102226 TaxID=1442371 RepID=A0A0D2KDL2_9EURO|nr:uncharacterized protein Z520_02872 [Fonsecaea multimorphosa CBS 102226]KIY01320.1 hypothetical protein Z520_02872 [Fonsecaea multimorphosa CBS 102226]OAL28597.1 hypothetical protein AYO22_02791 [Fonsecaea multimorphosa]
MPVFSAPYVGLPDPEKRTVETMETPLNQITSPERRNKSWYKKLSFSSRSIGKSGRSSRTSTGLAEAQARSEEEYLLNKPLPPLPQPPYFEYMFADAGLKAMMSNESLKSTLAAHSNAQGNRVPSAALEFLIMICIATTQLEGNHNQPTAHNPPEGNFILESPELAQFAFAHAGVDVTTKDMIDNHFAALGTGLEGHLHIDIEEELEKEKASESFFGGIQAREGPTAYHAPVVDEDGFADRREGLEDWPQLWAQDKETLDDYVIPGSESLSMQLSKTADHEDNGDNGVKPILQPKSQKKKAKAHFREYPDSYYNADGTVNDPEFQPVQPVQPPRPLTIRKKVKKRNARDSFVTRSTPDEPKTDDHDIHLLSTKKIRVAEKLVDQDVNSSSRVVSVCGSISNSSSTTLSCHDEDDRSRNSASTAPTDVDDDDSSEAALALKRKRLTTDLTGYPGQFESYEANYLHVRVRRSSNYGDPVPFTMGDPLHPNNEFTHTNFVQDPTYPSTNYTKADLEVLPVRRRALDHAERCAAHAASLVSVRSAVEETLRREVHRECAAARLEGVSVGQYRYYQGFMSVEDYVAARICVCWGFCWCSKLCTLYGDVLCPCSEWIGVHGDD